VPDRLDDHDDAVDGIERDRDLEQRLVRIPLPIQPGRIGLYCDHAVPGLACRPRDAGDQRTEVEPPDHRRQHADGLSCGGPTAPASTHAHPSIKRARADALDHIGRHTR
jgi:hypothetical protein